MLSPKRHNCPPSTQFNSAASTISAKRPNMAPLISSPGSNVINAIPASDETMKCASVARSPAGLAERSFSRCRSHSHQNSTKRSCTNCATVHHGFVAAITAQRSQQSRRFGVVAEHRNPMGAQRLEGRHAGVFLHRREEPFRSASDRFSEQAFLAAEMQVWTCLRWHHQR